ncbi:hypothetical protein CY35_15G050400 [Sphagnum magellanicum]|nr:hypothetical protein CY35_15G050400 [Sphagnum magellanicum]
MVDRKPIHVHCVDVMFKSCLQLHELENFPYKEILESIQFVTIGSRLNNSYSIGSASIFGAKPKKAHCQVVSKIMKHFKGASNLALTYGESFQNNVFIAYNDINYIVNDIDNKKNRNPIAWTSRKQPCITNNVTQTKYITISTTTKEVI